MKTMTKRITGLGTLSYTIKNRHDGMGDTAGDASLRLTREATIARGAGKTNRLGQDVTDCNAREQDRQIAALASDYDVRRIDLYTYDGITLDAYDFEVAS